MSKDLNLCQFIGRLGQEPDVRQIPNGGAVANFSIAVGDDYKDKSGNKVEQTEWVRCVAFGRLAEIIQQYVGKGSQVYVSGKIKTRKWQKDGVDQYTTEINVSDLQMLGSRSGEEMRSNSPSQSKPPQNEQQSNPQPQAEFDDDIPF